LIKDKKIEKLVKRSIGLSFWLIYIFTFPASYRVSGFSAAVLSLLPVCATAWMFGARWGLISGILNTPLTMALHHISAGSISEEPMGAYVLGTAVIAGGGLFIGYLSDLSRKLYAELHERNRVEEQLQQKSIELQQQKQYYEALVQNSPIAIVSLTPDQKIKSCNPSFEKLFGYKEEEIIGLDLDPLVAGADHLQEAKQISKKVQAGTPVQGSGKRRTKSGDLINVDLYGVPVIIDGKQDGILGQYVDITEKKLAEIALQEQLNFLQTIIDVIPVPIMYKDTDGIYLGCNKAFAESVGKSKEEIIGKTTHEILPKETADFISELDCNLLENPGIRTAERQMVYADQSTRDILLTMATFNDIHGNLAGIISARIDITEMKQKERELIESEERFRSIFEYASEGVIILDTTGNILSWNPSAENIFGYSEAEIVGKNIVSFMPPDRLQDYQNRFTHQMGTDFQDQIGKTFEAEGKRKDGTIIPIELSLSIWQVEDENFISVIIRDVTERKAVEEELTTAKTIAEEAARVKAQFLAHMSHEIRTPLNAVIGMTGLLFDTPLSADQQDFVETIRLSGDSLLEVINGILDYSKIEAGRLDLENNPFNLRSCIESALDLVSPSAAQRAINLAYVYENSTPGKIVGDQTRLRQILVNLLANAIKFTEEGEVVVAVCANKRSENQYEIHFSVRDTGIGISPEDLELLFQSFSQVDSSSKRKYGGTGLGLAISKNLVEAMGGEIHVESEKGEGSIFSFWIVAETLPDTSPLFPVGDQPELLKKRILIFDGNLTNLRIVAQHAQSWGMEPSAFQDGENVLKNLNTGERYDIGILNCNVTEVNGKNLFEEIKKLHKPYDLPILCLRSLGGTFDIDVEIENLITGFVTKPIKPAILFDVLMKALKYKPTPVQEIVKPVSIDKQMGQQHPLKILLAEDNPVNQKVAVKILEQMGYRPDIASNGFDVVHALERQYYDLILLDIQMPEMDGEQAAVIIRNNYLHGRQPRIVALTAHALEGDREKYLAAGMDDFISKPVHIEELKKVLEETPILSTSSRISRKTSKGVEK
jgi:PAS domain S-box-containing protein